MIIGLKLRFFETHLKIFLFFILVKITSKNNFVLMKKQRGFFAENRQYLIIIFVVFYRNSEKIILG
jgi:uncharacterized membrane protein YphA (DoxX/SURF4 family)